MYTKELDSYKTKASDSEKTKELGPKKNIKIFFCLSINWLLHQLKTSCIKQQNHLSFLSIGLLHLTT